MHTTSNAQFSGDGVTWVQGALNPGQPNRICWSDHRTHDSPTSCQNASIETLLRYVMKGCLPSAFSSGLLFSSCAASYLDVGTGQNCIASGLCLIAGLCVPQKPEKEREGRPAGLNGFYQIIYASIVNEFLIKLIPKSIIMETSKRVFIKESIRGRFCWSIHR